MIDENVNSILRYFNNGNNIDNGQGTRVRHFRTLFTKCLQKQNLYASFMLIHFPCMVMSCFMCIILINDKFTCDIHTFVT